MRRQETKGNGNKAIVFAYCLLYTFFFALSVLPAQAAGPDTNPITHWDTRYNYFMRFPAAKQHGVYDPQYNPDGHDHVEDQRSQGPGHIIHEKSGSVFEWPVKIMHAQSEVPTLRDEAISENLFQTFGYPVSDTQFQIIERYNHNRFLEQLYDPEKVNWMATSVAGVMANSAGNSAANMATNQCINAIDYVRQPLGNFTAEPNNVWQQIRYELFIPMAVLLLLPGAVLAQVRAIVAQGNPVLGDVSPFEGILRSVIAIFLIPGSFLVINYGIDVSNSLTYTIANEYHRMFGSNMYEDAKCAIKRALPINDPNSNKNDISPPTKPPIIEHDVWSPYESWDLTVRWYDPCAHIDESRLADEDVPASMMINRLLFNSTISTLGLTWNIYCAFQLVFLYYLWCMGPVASALWVWPIPRLRSAFGNWVEGVIILCFWALFWNTSIFLLAAFKGIGDSGTVYTAALVFLCVQSVKSAFDFVSLVSSAASGAESMAKEALGQLSSSITKAAGRDKAASGAATSAARNQGPAMPNPAVMGSAKATGGVGGGSSGAGAIGAGADSPVGKAGLSSNLSVSPSPMAIGGGGGAAGADKGGGAGGGGDKAGGGKDPGLVGSGPDATGAGAGKDAGPPPGEGGKGKGDDAAGGAAAAAIGALGGLGGGGKEGAGAGPPLSNLNFSPSLSSTKLGGDVNAGDVSQSSNLDKNLANNLDNKLTDNNMLGGPPISGDKGLAGLGAQGAEGIGKDAMNAAHDKLFGPDSPLSQLDSKTLQGGADALLHGPDQLSGGLSDKNALSKDLALDQMTSRGSQHDIMQNGIDRDVAGNPQAEMARATTQELMKAGNITDQQLDKALHGGAQEARAIQDKLGVSPMTLELARGGDPGAAALTMEAAGRNAIAHPGVLDTSNSVASEAVKMANGPISSTRDDLLHQAAVENRPEAARALLAQNGEHTVAAMASAQSTQQELRSAGVTSEQMQRALSGDQGMQQTISEKMGGTGFDKIQAAYHGDTGDAATVLANHGRAEMQQMQRDGASPEQIHNHAVSTGNVAILAAEAAAQAPQGGGGSSLLDRALGNDGNAQRELQQSIGSNARILEAANSGNPQAVSAIEGATGQDARVMGAASHNTQDLLRTMSGDARSVEQALNGSPQERGAFIQQMSSELGVSPRVLSAAVNGGSLEASTVMARAGQIAESGSQSQGAYQLSDAQQRLVSGYEQGGGLMQTAVASYHGQNAETLNLAAGGSASHALAVQSTISGGEVSQLAGRGNAEAGSVVTATGSVTHSGSDALSSYTAANPTASLHSASISTQSALSSVGINPEAVVHGIKSGDTSELQRAATVLSGGRADVQPAMMQSVERALMQGSSGDAMTVVGAAGRHMLSQGSEAVQAYSRDPSAQLSMHVAQSVPQNVLDQAMHGNTMAQAHIARSVSCDPQVLSSAASNEYSMRAVGSTLGEHASVAVAASQAAQQLVSLHPDSNLVQTALHGQGTQQLAAIEHLARDMNVTPQVLSNSLSGSSQDLSAMVGASAAGLARIQETGQGSAYFGAIATAGADNPIAQAVHAAGANQSTYSVGMAAMSYGGAQDAVRSTIESNPHLARLGAEGNVVASNIQTAASGRTYSEDCGVYQQRYDTGSATPQPAGAAYSTYTSDPGALAVAAISSNLTNPATWSGGGGHVEHRVAGYADQRPVSGYDQFTQRAPDPRAPEPRYEAREAHHGGGLSGAEHAKPQPPTSEGGKIAGKPAGDPSTYINDQIKSKGDGAQAADKTTSGWFGGEQKPPAGEAPQSKLGGVVEGAAPQRPVDPRIVGGLAAGAAGAGILGGLVKGQQPGPAPQKPAPGEAQNRDINPVARGQSKSQQDHQAAKARHDAEIRQRIAELNARGQREEAEELARRQAEAGGTFVPGQYHLKGSSAVSLAGVRVVFVIAPEQFRDEELFKPKQDLEACGAIITVASTQKGEITGMLGGKAQATRLILELNEKDYDAIVVVGGKGSYDHLWYNQELHGLLKQFHNAGKVYASICLSGAVLANAGVLIGKKATVAEMPETVQALSAGRAIFIRDLVVADGKAITASGPEAVDYFAQALIQELTPKQDDQVISLDDLPKGE